MRSMAWPPVIENGRCKMEQGAEATRTLVMQTLGDLQQNPFNPDGLSLGDVTFRVHGAARARIHSALTRLQKVITIQQISEIKNSDGSMVIIIEFLDKETRSKGSALING